MRGLTFGHVAEANARKYPDDTCLVTETAVGEEHLTFSEFDGRVNRVAHLLRDRGVGEGDRVAVYSQNNAETLETYLGAMKLGALPVPVNHRFKDEEVGYVVRDSGAGTMVFDREAAPTVEAVREGGETPLDRFFFVGEDVPEYAEDFREAREAASAERVEVVPDRLDDAALMYTSGTTGKPKGCVLTHDNVVQNAVNTVYSSGFEENADNFLVVTPLFHVAAFALFCDTFYTGSAVYLVDEFDPVRVMEVIEEAGITGSFFVPTMSRALLDVEDFESYDLSSFRHYMTGAAPSGRELKETIMESFGADLYDAFGQTEMSPVTTLLLPEDALDKPDSVGKPVINVTLKVVDDAGEEVEQGEIGRAAYKGPTAFREYLGMPEKTEEVFDDEGYFVSSDLVRRDEEGFVYFVGRYDDMIISGGENIHPAEIEEVLHEHEAISEVAVVGVPDEKWGERVKAVVVPREGHEVTTEEVTTFVEARLADFKKPREVVFRDELPRNPTGKVIKARLE
ncbi:class I adenylate-forming enzyme family protein [Halomarina litorea]|uniref:class I adenylate-forming enzyme family protein n=1 Tax=Halomarina litorea TaxID=2961595 RepID=UPI0020C4C9AC|nr:AMP-binding protein [Halomarina sp. BCD28]